jgi:Copper type II ascorbate-dependent monooxygenase, C-terminal domain
MTAALLLAGCSGTNGAAIGSSGIDPGSDSGVTEGDGASQGGRTYSVSLGPVTLAPGEERVVCMDRRIESDQPTDIVGISSDLTEGGHHLVFYKSNATEETTAPVACNSFRGFFAGIVPLYIAQKAHSELQYPPGVVYSLPAAQMVRIELHFLNTTQKPLDVTGSVRLKEARPGTVVAHANLLFYGNLNIQIPPLSKKTVGPSFHAFGAKTPTIFGLTGHQHHRGTGVTIELASSATAPGTMLYDNDDWADPPLTSFDPPIATTPGQGFRYSCTYDNPTNHTVAFGEGFNEEMCFLWAYYYPDMGFDLGLDH